MKMIVRITINILMKIETKKLKIVKSKDSISVISDESVYYAKGISKRRNLKGKEYEYKYIIL
jgi:hypothetical protein